MLNRKATIDRTNLICFIRIRVLRYALCLAHLCLLFLSPLSLLPSPTCETDKAQGLWSWPWLLTGVYVGALPSPNLDFFIHSVIESLVIWIRWSLQYCQVQRSLFGVIYLKTQLTFYTIYSENSNSVNNLAREMRRGIFTYSSVRWFWSFIGFLLKKQNQSLV